ncbi:hypothetical protein LAZ67_23000301 [Cordylochernes scorpioides]|uniref:Uncharacterized protein n=1 Tax=Cordylochernes scorpioides TaxID=51811 RepID=A0ABY6LRS2_9ARAC|nr:hypothetical protein LAZ67_23000301 [Cordylochernes scorpioides]
MLITIFDSRGIIHKEFVPAGQTITGEYYLNFLKRLIARICRIRPEYRDEDSWCLLHDNAPSHSSLIVRRFLAKNNYIVGKPCNYKTNLKLVKDPNEKPFLSLLLPYIHSIISGYQVVTLDATMSSEVESPELEESPAKAEKAAGGRRNPRRSTRNANPIKSEDSPESRKPSRKGSETRVTRSKSNRSRKKSGSPTFRSSKGSLGMDSQESPAARVKSSRRASSRVNYKESEGEEDPLPELPKEEEEFKSEDDWDDSEGGEGKKKKEASSKRSPAKSRRTVAKEGKSRSRTSRSKRSDRSKRGKKDETEEEEDDEESNKEDEKSDEKEASVDSDKKDLPTDEEEAKKTSDAGNAVNEEVKEVINKEPTENQVEEVPPSDNKDPADADPEKKEEKQDPSSQESAKRKLEEVEENDESEEARKKPKLETEVVKSNESSYHRSSPVIVENKQFSEASKETPMEVDTNDGDSTAVTTNETSTNDSTEHSHPLEPSINGSSLLTKHTQSIPGLYIANPSLPPEKIDHLRPYTFTLVSYNLQGPDSTLKENNCANEIKSRMADIVCLQSITSSFFTEKIQSISKELGYHDVMTDGLALLYKPNVFEIVSNSPISLHSLIERDLEGKPAEVVEAAMKYLKDLCCKAYVVELRSLLEGSHLLRLCNVALPALLDPSCTTLLMCRLLKEINSSPDLPHILCGEFNPVNWVSQVLVTGYISDELDQEMRRRKDIFLSNQEAISLVEVLPNLHSNTSLQYTNCYTTVMGSQKSSGGSEQVWASANSLGTLGVWEPALALQARLAFSE